MYIYIYIFIYHIYRAYMVIYRDRFKSRWLSAIYFQGDSLFVNLLAFVYCLCAMHPC